MQQRSARPRTITTIRGRPSIGEVRPKPGAVSRGKASLAAAHAEHDATPLLDDSTPEGEWLAILPPIDATAAWPFLVVPVADRYALSQGNRYLTLCMV